MPLKRNAFRIMLIGTIFLAANINAETIDSITTSPKNFEQQIRSAVTPMAGKEIIGLKVLRLSGDIGPWLDTGMMLKPGDKITMILEGKKWLSRALNLSFNAPLATWAKIGADGLIFRGSRKTNTFTSSTDGSLRLKLYPSVRWLDVSGNYLGEPTKINPDAGGGVDVAIIHWNNTTNVQQALNDLAERNPAIQWAKAELDRQKNQKSPPKGWQNIWEFNPSEIFTEVTVNNEKNAPNNIIELNMHDDVSIIEKEASFDLTPQTTLSWKWKIKELPSLVAENSLPSHDYMSIAVKFDNGRDLTFFWSSELAIDKAFHCPLPGWAHRETHVVARTGKNDLNKWLSEEKNIFEYYKKTIGGVLPKKITHIWLIGVSVFQHTDGLSQFGDIILKDDKTSIQVY